MFLTHFFSIFVVLSLASFSATGCDPGTFREPDGTCTKCPVGTENLDQVNAPRCTPCLAGFAAFLNGKTPARLCTRCLPGTFSKKRSRSCTPCPPGTNSTGTSSKCFKCGPGKKVGFFGCEECPPNTFSDGNSNLECRPCPEGSVSSKGSARCQKCPKGTLLAGEDFPFEKPRSCKECIPGTFGDVEGAISCKICRPGTFSGKGATECTPCPAGQFAPLIGSKECLACPTGTTSKKGSAACKDPNRGCTRDTFDDGSERCSACIPGERLDVKKNKCVSCGEGEVSDGGAVTVCRRCKDGRVPVKNIAFEDGLNCRCPLGTVEVFGGDLCKPCGAGTFGILTAGRDEFYTGAKRSRGARSSDALECDFCDGVIRTSRDGPQCELCPKGTRVVSLPFTGIHRCEKCPKGFALAEDFYSFECRNVKTGCGLDETLDRGRCRLVNCPPNTILLRSGCGACKLGWVYDPVKEDCVRCPPGQTSAGGVTLKCEDCPPNMESRFSGVCECIAGFEPKGGVCVPCMPGTSKIDQGNFKCGACVTRRVAKNKGSEGCDSCGKREIANTDKTRCVKCPPGFKVAVNVRGDLIDKCVPKDPYEKI